MSECSAELNADDPSILECGDSTDDPSILECGDNDESVRLVEEDEMLLLSSPSPAKDDKPTSAATSKQRENVSEGVKSSASCLNAATSSDKILVEDSESGQDFDNSDNSVEVIGSDEEEEDLSEEEEEEVENVESSSMYLDGKVYIFHVHGALFVWNADDVRMLREECRIIGKLSGCLPRAPRQNTQLGLPLQLMPEEARLLEEIEAACVVEEDEVKEEDEDLRKTAFQQTRKENFKIQQKLFKESRKQEIAQHMDRIVAGKKAKRKKLKEMAATENSGKKLKTHESAVDATDNSGKKLKTHESAVDATAEMDSNLKNGKAAGNSDDGKDDEESHVGGEDKDEGGGDKEYVVDDGDGDDDDGSDRNGEKSDEEGDIPDVDSLITGETDEKHAFVQIFTENPWHRDVGRCKNWIFPLSQRDRLRYAVFRDLWRKGYYLTSGSKFGGDFLVYPGDPARFHSHFIAICLDVGQDMSVLDLVSMSRLASNVRKSALVCSFNKFRQVSYTSLQWTGMV